MWLLLSKHKQIPPHSLVNQDMIELCYRFYLLQLQREQSLQIIHFVKWLVYVIVTDLFCAQGHLIAVLYSINQFVEPMGRHTQTVVWLGMFHCQMIFMFILLWMRSLN